MSTKLFIGLLMFYVIAQILGNITDGGQMMTSANVADIQNMQDHGVTTSTDSSGATAQFISTGTGFFGTLAKVVTFDYSLFYDIDSTVTDATSCAAIGGTWQTDYLTCKVANNLSILRYLLMALGVVIIIEAIILFRQIIVG